MQTRILAITVMFIVVVSSIIVSCSHESNNEEIAMQVAQEWTSTCSTPQTGDYASAVAMVLRDSVPDEVDDSTLISIIREQLTNNATWTYTPEYRQIDVYEIEARTKFNFEIPQIGSGNMDVGFILYCSWEEKRVTMVGERYYSYEYNSSSGYLGS